MPFIKAIVMAAVLVLGIAALVFRDDIPFLQSYEGRVVRVFQDQLTDANTSGLMQEPSLEIDTGTEHVVVNVSLDVFNRARPGMHVKKRPFSKRPVLTQ